MTSRRWMCPKCLQIINPDRADQTEYHDLNCDGRLEWFTPRDFEELKAQTFHLLSKGQSKTRHNETGEWLDETPVNPRHKRRYSSIPTSGEIESVLENILGQKIG